MCLVSVEAKRGIGFPGLGAVIDYESPNIGAGKQIQFF